LLPKSPWNILAGFKVWQASPTILILATSICSSAKVDLQNSPKLLILKSRHAENIAGQVCRRRVCYGLCVAENLGEKQRLLYGQ
jgi:hypothetical protein